MTTRRRLTIGGSAALVLLAAVLALYAGRGGEAAPESDAPRNGRQGMDMGGMDMGGMATGDGTVRLSPGEINAFGVTFGTAEVRPLSRQIRAVGLIEFDETRMAYVSPKFGGWAERLYADFTGEPVREGQPLLEVYSPELVTAQEELLLAARMAESVGESRIEGVASGAADLLASAKRRLGYWDISEAQIEEVLRTGEVRKTLTLYAPVSGIVMNKDVFEGQAFRAGQNLYMIADLSEVWLSAEVFEADAALLHEGMPAEITVAALPGKALRGRVEYVYPMLGQTTRSMEVRIALPNRSAAEVGDGEVAAGASRGANSTGELKPGMYATVRFSADLGRTLTVPSSAVLHTGERAVAFVDMGGGQLMPHEVTLGQAGEAYVQVLEGLEPGQRVVTSAQFLLDSESNLAEVMKAMMAQMNMSDMGSMDMEDMDMGGMDMPGGETMDMPGMDMQKDSGVGGMKMQDGQGTAGMKMPGKTQE